MPDGSDSVLVFGPFRLFPAQRRLEKDGKTLRLGGRALDILIVLAERAGEVVSNRALLESVWQDVTVEESSLRFHIKNLRKILGDGQSGTRYVSNVPGRGYCFVAPTTRINARDSSGDQPAARRYALPRFATRVIGRESVIDALAPQLAERGPLTIVGPGGIGKSTVALALAHARQADYRHGVCFVDLAPLTDPALVLAVVAAALELPLPSGDPSAALIGFLRDKQILLVLDSCDSLRRRVGRRIFRPHSGHKPGAIADAGRTCPSPHALGAAARDDTYHVTGGAELLCHPAFRGTRRQGARQVRADRRQY